VEKKMYKSGLIILLPLLLSVVVNLSAQNKNQFFNPILAGFYPDPSICRVGGDYYLVNSTFSYYPGIPIFHSTDLVNWELIGHAMNRPEQLNLENLRVSEGIYAPSIRFHEGIFYITCTFVGGGGNFVITSKSPAGQWTNPVWIPQINGIDPSLYFDEDGKSFILYNSIAPNNKPLYDGHRTIRMFEFDIKELRVIGNEYLLVNGGTDINKKPVWIEGPHIFKKDSYYYLIAAEGGTGDYHSQVVFRNQKIDGPYLPYENNPILTQRHLNPKREFAITSTGHADFVQTESGDWWSVFLGCRPYPPYEEGYYNTGRETFLAPVKWKNGWPVINPDYQEVQYQYPYPIKSSSGKLKTQYNGNFKLRDDFDKNSLDQNWVFLRTPKEKWYDLKTKKGFLSIHLRPEMCSEKVNPSFLGHRQQHTSGYVSLAVNFSPTSENEKAGLMVFQNENHFYYLCKSISEKKEIIQLYKSSGKENPGNKMELLAAKEIPKEQNKKEIYLKIEALENMYSFFYSYDNEQWNLLKDKIDARFLSTKIAGGFVGCMYAIYATSLGKTSKNKAFFDWFEYEGNDKVYNK
jgi:alpha-N-arabinofuranosidase